MKMNLVHGTKNVYNTWPNFWLIVHQISFLPLVALPVLVSCYQGQCDIDKVANILSKLLQMVVLGFISHRPLTDKWTIPVHLHTCNSAKALVLTHTPHIYTSTCTHVHTYTTQIYTHTCTQTHMTLYMYTHTCTVEPHLSVPLYVYL